MKKPYIKKAGNFCGFKVFIVDGKYIRNNLDEEFTNFGHYYSFKFIPKKEFWIDKEHNPNEKRYYIDHMLVEYHLREKGKNYDKALEAADRAEKTERAKSKAVKKAMQKIKHKKTVLAKIHKKLIKGYKNNKIKIWIVRGNMVRSLFFIDFTEGGHDKVYSFVPNGEVWIDDDLSPKERKFVILHELHERNLMSRGMNYDNAHKSSSEVEHFCRRYPQFLDIKISAELKRIK